MRGSLRRGRQARAAGGACDARRGCVEEAAAPSQAAGHIYQRAVQRLQATQGPPSYGQAEMHVAIHHSRCTRLCMQLARRAGVRLGARVEAHGPTRPSGAANNNIALLRS